MIKVTIPYLSGMGDMFDENTIQWTPDAKNENITVEVMSAQHIADILVDYIEFRDKL